MSKKSHNVPEGCGIWLTTRDIPKKRKTVVPRRRSTGIYQYQLTQTKLVVTANKQTKIADFFSNRGTHHNDEEDDGEEDDHSVEITEVQEPRRKKLKQEEETITISGDSTSGLGRIPDLSPWQPQEEGVDSNGTDGTEGSQLPHVFSLSEAACDGESSLDIDHTFNFAVSESSLVDCNAGSNLLHRTKGSHNLESGYSLLTGPPGGSARSNEEKAFTRNLIENDSPFDPESKADATKQLRKIGENVTSAEKSDILCLENSQQEADMLRNYCNSHQEQNVNVTDHIYQNERKRDNLSDSQVSESDEDGVYSLEKSMTKFQEHESNSQCVSQGSVTSSLDLFPELSKENSLNISKKVKEMENEGKDCSTKGVDEQNDDATLIAQRSIQEILTEEDLNFESIEFCLDAKSRNKSKTEKVRHQYEVCDTEDFTLSTQTNIAGGDISQKNCKMKENIFKSCNTLDFTLSSGTDDNDNLQTSDTFSKGGLEEINTEDFTLTSQGEPQKVTGKQNCMDTNKGSFTKPKDKSNGEIRKYGSFQNYDIDTEDFTLSSQRQVFQERKDTLELNFEDEDFTLS